MSPAFCPHLCVDKSIWIHIHPNTHIHTHTSILKQNVKYYTLHTVCLYVLLMSVALPDVFSRCKLALVLLGLVFHSIVVGSLNKKGTVGWRQKFSKRLSDPVFKEITPF